MSGEGSSQKEIQAKNRSPKKNYKQCCHHWSKVINSRDEQHGVYDNQAIAPYWQTKF